MAVRLARLIQVALGVALLSLGLSACGAALPQNTAPTSQSSQIAPGTVSAHLNGRVNFYAGAGGSS